MKTSPRLLDGIWVLLLAGTAWTWWLGEQGATGAGVVISMLLVAGLKGGLVVSEYMALRGVRWFWPLALTCWLLLVLGSNLALYWRGN